MHNPRSRIGHGYDVHAIADSYDPAKPLVMAGITLPDAVTLKAHSDGDVVLHALCDALLGALAEGDIGLHFPDTDPEIAGISSTLILDRVLELLAARNGSLCNIDITIVCQVPRIAPHYQAMKDSLQSLLGLASSRVNIKATTTEKLGAIGRREGIACYAVALLECDD